MFKKLLLAFLIFQFCNINAQKPRIKFRHLKVEDGLSQSWVKSICQDKYGFMWFGTNHGLNKYDGYNFTVYTHNPQNENTIRDNSIETIYEDKNGNLWIGTAKGLNLYDREKDRFIHHTFWPQNLLTDILELEDGRLFITTLSRGLYLVNPKNNHTISFLDNTNNSANIDPISINCITIDKNGFIWLGTSQNGLCLLDTLNNMFIYYNNNKNNPLSISDNHIASICTDSKDRIWIGTRNNGLDLFQYEKEHPEKGIFIHYKHNPNDQSSISNGAVISLLADKQGYLWVGTENGGLDILDLNQLDKDNCIFYHYRHNPYNNFSLSNNSIHSLYQDRNGSIWIGTFGDGINIYNKLAVKFIHHTHDPNNVNSLSNNFVNVFFEDDDHLWIGTEGGLNRFDKKSRTYKHYVHDPNDDKTISSNSVWAINKDSKGNIWIGTWAGGLNLCNLKNDTFTRFKYKKNIPGSLGNNNIFSILEDRDENLWVATMGGGINLFDHQNKTFKKYLHNENEKSSLSNNWIHTLFETSYGEIWLSASNSVDLFDKEKETFLHFKHDDNDTRSISCDDVNIFFEDSKKNLWIGTSRGLNVFNRNDSSFSYYLEEHGLPNDQINGILEDTHDNLWISTNNGISKFVHGIEKPEKPIFKNYNISDGLQGNEFRARSCWKGQDGRMYFGGKNGFNVFHPDSLKENWYVPPVYITNFFLFNRRIEIGASDSLLKSNINQKQKIAFSYKQSVFSFEYAALNYVIPEKNQYAYILDGFDQDWNYVGNQRMATYTNLDPGQYIFRVKGSNNDGIWNEEGTSIKIIITPPFWKTLWFRIPIFLIFITLIYSIYKIRVRNIENHRHELENKVKERTKELSKKALELARSNKNLTIAKKETDNILQNVEEGFFLLDNKYRIGNSYSAALENIFQKTRLANNSLIEYFKKKIPSDDLVNLTEYLEFMFQNTIDEIYLKKLNPLEQIKVNFNNTKSNENSEKYLNIVFKRILSNGNGVHHLFVTVKDITKNIKMKEELEKSELEKEKMLQLVSTLMDNDPDLIKDFFETTRQEISQLEILLNQSGHKKRYKPDMDEIFRLVNLIRMNSETLNIATLKNISQIFENVALKTGKMNSISHEEIDKLSENYQFLKEEFFCLDNLLKYIYSAILEYHREVKQ